MELCSSSSSVCEPALARSDAYKVARQSTNNKTFMSSVTGALNVEILILVCHDELPVVRTQLPYDVSHESFSVCIASVLIH
jgi:hypothetical protein